MHVIDMDNDPQWYEKLRENRAEAQADPRVQAVQVWAKDNYERGADVIVEAFEPDEILELVSEAKTAEQAVISARRFCGLRAEQAANVYAQSGEHEAERAEAMRTARELGR